MAGKSSEAGHHKDVNDSLLPSTSSNVATAAAAAVPPTAIPSIAGKTLQLPVVASTFINSTASCSSKLVVSANTSNSSSLLHSCTKRSHHSSNILSAKSTVSNSNFHHHFDANCKSPSTQQKQFVTPNQNTIKIVSNSESAPVEDATESIERILEMASPQVTTTAPKTGCSIKKESLSCDSISKSTFACVKSAEQIDAGMDGSAASPMSEYQNLSLLSVNSVTSAYGSSGSSCGNNISSTSTVTASNAPMISLSKSETNIFEGNDGDAGNRISVYSVVSLNDLNESDPFLNWPMNDLSKTQCLNQI